MIDQEKQKIDNTTNQENQKEIGSLAEVKKYVDDNKEELKTLDVDTFVSLSNSLEKLSNLESQTNETESKQRLDELLNTLATFKDKFENEEKKNEVQKLIDILQKEKEDLENLKKEIGEDTESEQDKEAGEEEGTDKESWFKKNWKKLAIGGGALTAGILGWRFIKNIRERRQFVAGKIEDLKKQEAYKGMSDRKLKRIAKEEYDRINGDSEGGLGKKLLKWGMIAGGAVGGFFGIKWLYNKYFGSNVEKPEVIPPIDQDDTKIVAKKHQEEVVDFKNSTFKKREKDDVKFTNNDYTDKDGNKVNLMRNVLGKPLEITYKKDIGRVVPDGDINVDGYKELKNEKGEAIQPNFIDNETIKPEDCEDEIYYLEFDEKKTEVITAAPLVEQLQKAIEENKKRSKEGEEGVGDLTSQRGNIGCVVYDNKGKEIKDRDKLTEDDFNKKVSRVSISSWIGGYDEKTGESNKFTTDIGLIEEGGKKYFRIPGLKINLEKDPSDKSYSSLHTMVWLANLTNFCLYKNYGDKTKDNRHDTNWLDDIGDGIKGLFGFGVQTGEFFYFTGNESWWSYENQASVGLGKLEKGLYKLNRGASGSLSILKHETLINKFKKEDGNSLWQENYGEVLGTYLNTRMAQYEEYDEKLTETKE